MYKEFDTENHEELIEYLKIIGMKDISVNDNELRFKDLIDKEFILNLNDKIVFCDRWSYGTPVHILDDEIIFISSVELSMYKE